MKSKWVIKKIGDLCDEVIKKAPREIYRGKFTYIDISSVDPIQKKIVNPKLLTVDLAPGRARKIVTTGDVIFATTRPYLENIAKIKAEFTNPIVSTGFCVMSPKSELLDSDYLFHYVTSPDFINKVVAKQKGAAYPAVSDSDVFNMEIPLPSLEVQKKIVKVLEEKLGKVKEAIKLREESIADTEKIVSSKINEIFSEGREKHFGIYLDKLATLVRGPFGGSLTKGMFIDKGYAVYEQGNVIGDQLNTFRYFIGEEKYNDMIRFSVKPGDILMSCSGTIGKFTYIKNDYTEGIINQALLKITPNLQQVSREYLQYALIDYLKNSTSHVKGAAIKNIASVKELKKIKVPVPDLNVQNEIVRQIKESSQKVLELRKLQESQLSDLKALEQAYLREAFNGDLI